MTGSSTPLTSAREATSSDPETTLLSSLDGRRVLDPQTPSGSLQTNTMASHKLPVACQLRRKKLDVLSGVEISYRTGRRAFFQMFVIIYQMSCMFSRGLYSSLFR